MHIRLEFSRVVGAIALVSVASLNLAPVGAQSPPPTPAPRQDPASAPAQEHDGHDKLFG